MALALGAGLVWLLALAGPAAAQPNDECVTCHSILDPGIVSQWEHGRMGDGMNGDATCVDCHGADHEAIEAAQGHVSASVCAGCHPDQYGSFTAKDSHGAFTNKHAVGWTKMTAGARYQIMPAIERLAMCERCHNIGYISKDGSVGKCDSCHTRHTFSKEEAAEPEACGTCHMGPDHEQIDMWSKSKHGVVYATEKSRAGGDPSRAPTCVTCHMPESTPAGGYGPGQPLTHDVSSNITYGTVSQGAAVLSASDLSPAPQPVPMRIISSAEFQSRRQAMTAVCSECHSQPFATRNLENADQIKADVDAKLWDPVMRIRGLWYDGLLDPMPAGRPPHPQSGTALVLGGQQLYSDTSAIEQLLFQTYKYDHVSTFKGAYHINPDYSHWFGWARVNSDLDLIRGEEARLRKVGIPYDAGFVAPQKIVVGSAATLDAGQLAAWGDASANTYQWYFGDGESAAAAVDSSVSHVWATPGTFTVRLTCSDSDLVNTVATPLACSAKRTTTAAVVARYSATLTFPKPSGAGVTKTFKTKVTTAGDAYGTLQLQKKSNGVWKVMTSRSVSTTGGVAKTVSVSVKVKATATFRWQYSGDANTWGVSSSTRKVAP